MKQLVRIAILGSMLAPVRAAALMPIATTSGIDDWSVSVVPGPAASALVGVALFSQAARRSRPV
jgi:hypothetical protein